MGETTNTSQVSFVGLRWKTDPNFRMVSGCILALSMGELLYYSLTKPICLGMRGCTRKNPNPTSTRDKAKSVYISGETLSRKQICMIELGSNPHSKANNGLDTMFICLGEKERRLTIIFWMNDNRLILMWYKLQKVYLFSNVLQAVLA